MSPAKTMRKRRSARATARPKAGDQPLPGYRVLELLGRGGFGEVWKCEAPGGLLKAVKFVHGRLDGIHGSASAEEELRAIERVKAIRHPFLLSMERVESVAGNLVIVLELADKNLYTLLQEYREAGQPGIPRDDLLGYLREAAEALDVLNVQHGLLHLDVKPQNLFLVSGHVKVGDFGLVSSIAAAKSAARRPLHQEALTPMYAAPELHQGAVSRFSDQYSLAIVYQELLTGTLPFDGKSARQLMVEHLQAEPDLGPLCECERAAIARALQKDPDKRFPSCTTFVQALTSSRSVVTTSVPPTGGVLGEYLASPAAPAFRKTYLESRFASSLPRSVIHARMEGFRRQWHGEPIQRGERDFVFRVKTPRSFWQRWLSRRPGLEVHIHIAGSTRAESESTDVTVCIRPRALRGGAAIESLWVIGLLLLENVRNSLQTTQRRRGQERMLWPHEFEACPVLTGGQPAEPVTCRGIDISMSGIGFLAPRELGAGDLTLRLPPTPQTPAVEVPARVMRTQCRADGWWEVGAVLLAPNETAKGGASAP